MKYAYANERDKFWAKTRMVGLVAFTGPHMQVFLTTSQEFIIFRYSE